MSFFGSIMKTIGNATQDAITKNIAINWKKINSVNTDRLEEVYKERQKSGQYDATYTLIVLALAEKSPSSIKSDSSNEDVTRKIGVLKRRIELEESREFRQIREAIQSFERRFSS